jgi:hypothetical protein
VKQINLPLNAESVALSIEQAMRDYKRLGYSDNWINQRLKSIEIRKDLVDEWKKHGLEDKCAVHFYFEPYFSVFLQNKLTLKKLLNGQRKN